MNDSNNLVRTAARWWGDRLRRPPKMDNGDPRFEAIAHELLSFANERPVSDSTIRQFEAALESLLLERLRSEEATSVSVRVDYHPDELLQAAADRARLDLRLKLPVKTTMHINGSERTIEVKHGYGESFTQIYP